MTSQLNVALIHKLRGSLVRLDYFLTCYPWVYVQLVLADVWSTGAGIGCLYCIYVYTLSRGSSPFAHLHVQRYHFPCPVEELESRIAPALLSKADIPNSLINTFT